MGKRIRIQDVALKSDLSCATVSRYINNTAFVSESNSKLIQDAIDELGYIPNAAARILAKNRMMTIGLACSSLSEPYFSSLIRGIEKRSRQKQYALLIHSLTNILQSKNRKLPPAHFGHWPVTHRIYIYTHLTYQSIKPKRAGTNTLAYVSSPCRIL